MMLTGLADVLRSAHLAVEELDGWKARGHGPMTDVLGVTCHHTASGRGTGVTLGLGTVQHGRLGLDGPLAHLYLNRQGTFYVVAAGLCYHAGQSSSPRFTNEHRIGIEALAAGDGWSQDWPEVQVAAYARGCRVLAEHYGFAVAEVRGHKETCAPPGRKSDPSFSMPDFRRRVAAETLHAATAPKETEMQLSDPVELTDAAARAMSAAPGAGQHQPGELVDVEFLLLWGGPGLARVQSAIAALEARVAKLEAAVTKPTA